jgi:hypothetical protein
MWWLAPVIPVTWEMDIGGLWFKASWWDPISKNKLGVIVRVYNLIYSGSRGRQIIIQAWLKQMHETLSKKQTKAKRFWVQINKKKKLSSNPSTTKQFVHENYGICYDPLLGNFIHFTYTFLYFKKWAVYLQAIIVLSNWRNITILCMTRTLCYIF